jgi:hypothetical protein
MFSSLHSQSSHRRVLFRWLLVFCFTLGLTPTDRLGAQTATSKEYEIKAAFIYRLTQFMEWPTNRFSSSSEPITLGIAGTDPFGNTIDTVLKNQKVGERDIHIKRLESSITAAHTNCHLLFLGAGGAGDTEKIVSTLRDHAILTIGEEEEFTRNGGHVRLYIQDNKLRFEINIAAFERSGLKLHSQVMKLATRITRDGKDVKK